jgi:hypothetical protein
VTQHTSNEYIFRATWSPFETKRLSTSEAYDADSKRGLGPTDECWARLVGYASTRSSMLTL